MAGWDLYWIFIQTLVEMKIWGQIENCIQWWRLIFQRHGMKKFKHNNSWNMQIVSMFSNFKLLIICFTLPILLSLCIEVFAHSITTSCIEWLYPGPKFNTHGGIIISLPGILDAYMKHWDVYQCTCMCSW